MTKEEAEAGFTFPVTYVDEDGITQESKTESLKLSVHDGHLVVRINHGGHISICNVFDQWEARRIKGKLGLLVTHMYELSGAKDEV